ncbi:hypothetical protein JTE90_010643 [Oedothorax gibbosus]|uniref:Uncharacterized protein n=1 Tax=Oedothorax gibbosus TaxID=931172 RepID=A0AAV6UA55_9ARAC|nr:hypothetical protein JTE90_010643 [Oedothorax gibbosus]
MLAEDCILRSPPLDESTNWTLTVNPSSSDVWFKLRNFTFSGSSHDQCEMAFVSSTGQEIPLQRRSLTLFKMERYVMFGEMQRTFSPKTL